MEAAAAYLESHGVQAALTAAVARVAHERPADPIGALGSALVQARLPPSVRDVGFTTVGNLISEAESGALATRLVEVGIEPATRAESFASAARRLVAAGVDPSARATAFWVPGRVEVMGKHTDYAGGRSLLCAVNRGFAVVSADRNDAVCRVLASFELAGTVDEASVPLGSASAVEQLPDGWARYPAVTARRLAVNFGLNLGVDIAFECDLPEASGMSSSSAVVIVTFLALSARNALTHHPKFTSALPTPEVLCHYLGCIENGQDCGTLLPGDAGVGTFGGSEDHTAILLCMPGELRQYSFCPTRLEAAIPFPPGLVMLIAVSGATAQKGDERLKDYNDAVMLAKRAAAAADGGAAAVSNTLAAVVAAAAAQLKTPSRSDRRVYNAVRERIAAHDMEGLGARATGGSERLAAHVPAVGAIGRRFEQFFEESEVLVPGVGDAFA